MNTQRNADQTLLENTEYQYFIFHADTGEVSSGWSYREDAREALEDYPLALRVNARVLTRVGVARKIG